MQLLIIILIYILEFSLAIQNECICECCLDDNINCLPTFRSAINLNPLLKCNDITCNQDTCLTFSQCSKAFGKIIASCENLRLLSSSTKQTKHSFIFILIVVLFINLKIF